MTLLTTYCPSCDLEVVANILERPACLKVKGEDTPFTEQIAVCPHCGATIGDSRIEGVNLNRAFEEYAKSHNLLTASEIREARTKFGLSVREFSRFLGFGEQTYARYEAGSIPTQTNSNTIKYALTPQGAQSLLEMNGANINVTSQAKVKRAIEEMCSGFRKAALILDTLDSNPLEEQPPSIANGYRSFSIERAETLVVMLASKCKDFYVTKLQKAMFLCDFLSCERTGRSLTGLTYAHADHGPIINNREILLAKMRAAGIIDLKEQGWGEIVIPLSDGSFQFTSDELAIIDEVAACVNTFKTASSISDYSHSLSCWIDTSNGEIINYNHNFGEIERAVKSRL